MRLVISTLDHLSVDLEAQCPIEVELIRQLPGPDRDDYWLGEAASPIAWVDGDRELVISHVIIAARWQGSTLRDGITDLPIGLAFVVDDSQLHEPAVDFAKCRYVAIGLASDSDAAVEGS